MFKLLGQWRLLTKRDMEESQASAGLISLIDEATLKILEEHVAQQNYEHGKEAKLPRANRFRAYRLTVGAEIAAVVVLKASEAYSVCEVDLFLTGDIRGAEQQSSSSATLLFALCDTVKNGGSPGVQFTKRCAPQGLSDEVCLAGRNASVDFSHASAGVIRPEEGQKLLLALCGIRPETRKRVSEYADRRFFSAARIGFLVATGVWQPAEVEFLISCSPYPNLILGDEGAGDSRHLQAYAMSLATSCLLGSSFMRVLSRTGISEAPLQKLAEPDVLAGAMAYRYPRQTETRAVPHWSADPGAELPVPASHPLALLPRGRSTDEIRLRLDHDLKEAQEITDCKAILLYPSDFRRLRHREQKEARDLAASRRIQIGIGPRSLLNLEADVNERLFKGRNVRA